MTKRHALTDSQWRSIRNQLPGKQGGPGKTGENNRRFVDAVLYVLKTGVPWADLPLRFSKTNSVWRRFDRWCDKGVWELREETRELRWLLLARFPRYGPLVNVHAL